MPVINEVLNLGDLLKYEAPNLYSRDQVTVAAGQNLLVLGTVVGIETATAKVKQIDPAATDGTEVAVGILHLGRRQPDRPRGRDPDRPPCRGC